MDDKAKPQRPRVFTFLLGAALGALAVVAVLVPEAVMPLGWLAADDSLPAPDDAFSTEASVADWPPSEWKSDPGWQLVQYDQQGWVTEPVGTYANLAGYLDDPPEGIARIAVPVFPSVYTPDNQDKIYYDAIADSDIASGDKVLVIGTGSGADSWAAWRKCRTTVYAIDINPLAVTNARVTARIGKFDLRAVVGDFQAAQLPDDFRDFDYVLWNMPFVEAEANEVDFQQRNFHDGDNGAVAIRFLERLPDLLKPDGQAIALNYALARHLLNSPGTRTSVAPGDDPEDAITYMLFEIPNPATADGLISSEEPGS